MKKLAAPETPELFFLSDYQNLPISLFMKYLIYVASFCLFALSFSGCEKCYDCSRACSECQVLDEGGNVVETFESGCTDEEKAATALDCQAAADQNPEYTCTCAEGETESLEQCEGPLQGSHELETRREYGYTCIEK